MFFQGGLDCQRFCSPRAAEMSKRFTTTAMVECMEKYTAPLLVRLQSYQRSKSSIQEVLNIQIKRWLYRK